MNIIKASEGLQNIDIYKLTRSPSTVKLSEMKDKTINVKDYVFYEDSRMKSDGSVVTSRILSIRTADGTIYATNSPTFIDEYLYILDLFGEPGEIKVVGGTSRGGRAFITAEKM